MIQALTRYDVEIAKTFISARQAKSWASSEGLRYGAHRVVQQTAKGPRTIWRADQNASRGLADNLCGDVSSHAAPDRGADQ